MNSCFPRACAGSPAGDDEPATCPWIGPTTCSPGDPVRRGRHSEDAGESDQGEDDGQGSLADQPVRWWLCQRSTPRNMITKRKRTTMAARIDDDLHGSQEVGLLLDEEHGNAEERHHQREGGVHRVGRDDDADGPDQDHRRRGQRRPGDPARWRASRREGTAWSMGSVAPLGVGAGRHAAGDRTSAFSERASVVTALASALPALASALSALRAARSAFMRARMASIFLRLAAAPSAPRGAALHPRAGRRTSSARRASGLAATWCP